MKEEIKRNEKWLRIVANHCERYYRGIIAIEERYNIPIKLIQDFEQGIEKHHTNFYLCPLCIGNFILVQDAKIYCNEEFDLDHFPPKSIGGKETIMTCKVCNSHYGKEFDYAMKEYLEYQAYLNREGSFPAQISFDDLQGKFNVSVKWTNEHEFTILDYKNPSFLGKQIRDVAAKVDFETTPIPVKVKHTLPEISTIRKSLLKAAYLKMFSWFGYEFIFSDTGDNIRTVLLGRKPHILDDLGVFFNVEAGHLDNGIYAITDPLEYRCLLVAINTKLKNSDRNMCHHVIIPAMVENSWEALDVFKKVEQARGAEFIVSKLTSEVISGIKHPFSHTSHVLFNPPS